MGAATVAEVFIAITGACGVTLRPVYRYLRYGDPQGSGGSNAAKAAAGGVESWGAGIKTIGRITARGKNSAGGRSSFEMLEDDENGSQAQIVVAAGARRERDDVPLHGIRVDRDVTWTENRPEP